MLGQLIFCLEALGVKGAVCNHSKVHIEGLLAGDGLDIDVAGEAAQQTDPDPALQLFTLEIAFSLSGQ